LCYYDGISEEKTLRARKLRISNKRLHSSPDSHRGGHSYGPGIRVALVVAVMMVMMVVGRWVAVTGVAAPFSPAPPLGATVASEW
jgi:cytochrome c-type biogenesis protein CcmH/NrfG